MTTEKHQQILKDAEAVVWKYKDSQPQILAFRLAELMKFEIEAKATLRAMNILSTNQGFAEEADLKGAEWLFERRLS